MRKVLLAVFFTLVVLSATTDAAFARWGSSGSSHSSSGHKTPPGTYVEKKCKTSACFKKHPTGHYGFVTGERKRKE